MVQRSLFEKNSSDWKHELDDLVRGAAGGFLFGIPLMYTMEVWWIGSYAEPPLMLGILGITFILLLLLNRTDGFRQSQPASWKQDAMDSIEEMAIGILCVLFMLILLREIDDVTPLRETVGKVIFEAVPFSIGVALARSLLSSGEADTDEQPRNTAFADVSATLVGTIIIAFNIAPTDEIRMLSAASSPPWLLAIVATSLIISYSIVFSAGFTTQKQRYQHQGLFQTPIAETVSAYLISLAAAAFMLWFFHRLNFADPWTLWLRQTILLGLPATVGGAAGRLTI